MERVDLSKSILYSRKETTEHFELGEVRTHFLREMDKQNTKVMRRENVNLNIGGDKIEVEKFSYFIARLYIFYCY